MSPNEITRRTYDRLATAYDWFNERLFGGELPPCLITLQRQRKSAGYYWHDAVNARRGKKRTAEIALNPNAFSGNSDGEVMSTLVHEMVHLWQAYFGHPGRRGYHNRQWADKMEEVGLRASDTGQKGGMRTGESMSHYVIHDGSFEKCWGELYRTGFRLEWQSTAREWNKNKARYTCPGCSLNVWGKPGLKRTLACYPCKLFLVEIER